MSLSVLRKWLRTGSAKAIVISGIVLAAGAFTLHWLELQYAVRLYSTETWVIILALLFTALGVWVGTRLATAPPARPFEPNERAIATLGLTGKEIEVLALVADGHSNREIADRLFVSVSTVKTHLLHLYQKLEVRRRTEAVRKARSLRIIR